MRQFLQSQHLSMPWTCESGAEFASILGGQMVETLSCDGTFGHFGVSRKTLGKLHRGATTSIPPDYCG